MGELEAWKEHQRQLAEEVCALVTIYNPDSGLILAEKCLMIAT